MRSHSSSGFLLVESLFSLLLLSIFVVAIHASVLGLIKINQRILSMRAELISASLFLAETETSVLNEYNEGQSNRRVDISSTEGVRLKIVRYDADGEYVYFRYFLE